MTDFQNHVNNALPMPVEGSYASTNIHQSASAGEGSFIVGAGGVTVGRFAWADGTGAVTNAGTGAPTGFVHRENQALITEWLGQASMLIPVGRPITLDVSSDFWVKTKTVAAKGQKVFASTTDGTISTAAAGATVAGSVETKWSVASAGLVGDMIKMTIWG